MIPYGIGPWPSCQDRWSTPMTRSLARGTPLGLVALWVTALAQERVQETVVEKGEPDISGIDTSPTLKLY